MKRTFFVSMTLVIAAFFMACGDQGANNKPANNANSTPAATPLADNSADVKKLMGDLAAALAKNDADAAAKFYADDYHLITPQGVDQTKAERIEDMRSGKSKFESFEYTDINVRSYGDVAVAISTVKAKGTLSGQPSSPETKATLVLYKTKDGWKVVSGQATPVAAAAKAEVKTAANANTATNTAKPPPPPAANANANKAAPVMKPKTNANVNK